MSSTASDIIRLERKLDLILDALGLTDNRRLSPSEIREMAKTFIQQHREKREKRDGYECKKD